VYIEAAIPGRKRQFLWPAQLLRILRLLDLHPGMPLDKLNLTNTLVARINDTEPGYAGEYPGQENQIDSAGLDDAGNTLDSFPENQTPSALRDWSWVPIQVLTWQPRGDVVARYPELGFLLAPSVQFYVPNVWTAASCPPPRASEREVRRFFFRDLDTNLAHHHALGNLLAPTILGFQIGDHSLINATTPLLEDLEIAAVEGTAFQSRSRHRGELDTANPSKELWRFVQKRHKRWLKYGMRPLIFDDDAYQAWKPFWDQLFGPGYWTGGLTRQLIDGLRSGEADATIEARFQCADASLAIIDLRLLEEDQQPGVPIESLSGMRLLKLLQTPFAEPFCYTNTTPLLVFTSSQRFASEHLALINGADGFLHKPSRFEETEAAVELLTSIARFLHPAFGVVRNRIWWHECRQVTERNGKQIVYLRETLPGLRRFRDLLGSGLELADDPLSSAPGDNRAKGKSWSRSVDVCLALEVARETWLEQTAPPPPARYASEQSDRRWAIAGAFRGRRVEPDYDAMQKVSDPLKTMMDALQHFRHIYAHKGTGVYPDDRPPGWLAFANLLLASNIALRIRMEAVPIIPKADQLRRSRNPLNNNWWDIKPIDNAIAGYWACRQIFLGLEAAGVDLGKNDPVRGCIIEFARECGQEVLRTNLALFPTAKQEWLEAFQLTQEQIGRWPHDS
jgi:hypothetical protein